MLKEIHSFFELFDIFWGGVVTKIYILYFRREFVIAIFLARNASFMLDSYLHHIASGGMSHGYDSPRDCHVLFVLFFKTLIIFIPATTVFQLSIFQFKFFN